MGLQVEACQLSLAELVWDLARLLVTEVVDLLALERGEGEERAPSEFLPEAHRLIGRDERVAPE